MLFLHYSYDTASYTITKERNHVPGEQHAILPVTNLHEGNSIYSPSFEFKSPINKQKNIWKLSKIWSFPGDNRLGDMVNNFGEKKQAMWV